MITIEFDMTPPSNLKDIPGKLRTEGEVSRFVAECFKREDISNHTMNQIMKRAERQLYLLRLREGV